MTYIWATWLADVLRAGNCNVIEESGWKTRGRPASAGSFNPFGVHNHHTGSTTSNSNPHPTLRMCINGREGLPGPLCQVLICYAGHCHVIAAGRANHAGPCNGWGPFVTGDGNWQSIGYELDYNGTQRPSDAQLTATFKANAAVLKKLGKTANNLAGHSETSKTGKWDPGIGGKKVNMNTWRAETAKLIANPPPKPNPNPDGGSSEVVKPTDVVGKDSDGTDLTMGEMSARVNWLYGQWLEAGSLNEQLDRIEQKLDALK